jgi:hypothetical protein
MLRSADRLFCGGCGGFYILRHGHWFNTAGVERAPKLSSHFIPAEQGKPVSFLVEVGSRKVDYDDAGSGNERKRRPPCNGEG